jgi:hypothetical protein
MPGWALGSFLRTIVAGDLLGRPRPRFNARMGAGFFSTIDGARDIAPTVQAFGEFQCPDGRWVLFYPSLS